MFPLFESICINKGMVRHISWHQKRMDDAYYQYFNNKNPHDLSHAIEVPSPLLGLASVKARASYNKSGMHITYEPYHEKSINNLKMIFDDTISYPIKFEDRSALNLLFNQRENYDDILIIRHGMVTDSSYCNVLFSDGKSWFTSDTPLLNGTCRARLLAKGTVQEVPIHFEMIKKYTSFMLINAMMDFNPHRAQSIQKIAH